jgi:hypothetical protein
MVAARIALLVLAWLVPMATPAETAPGGIIAINVLLEPDRTMHDVAARANARLLASDPSGFALDGEHATHLTVVQAFVARGDLPRVFAAVEKVVGRVRPTDAELTATGLYYMPWQGRALAAIRVSPEPWLLDFQQQLIGALAPVLVPDGTAAAFQPLPDGRPVGPAIVAYVKDFVTRSSGRNYNPHITVGIAGEDFVGRMAAEPFTPSRFRAASASVYQPGEYGAAQRLLWTSD